jgi:Uma2 family endonuclease
MAETDTHRQEMTDTIETLAEFFRADPHVYVAGNLLLYYEEGNPAASVAPDVFIVRGIAKGPRRTYKLWAEGRVPNVVIEFTSRSTRLEDLGTKRALYAIIGVQEYFICDPLAEYLKPPLRGFRLTNGEYVPMMYTEEDTLLSEQLGLRLLLADNRLRLINHATGEHLLRPAEMAAALRAEAEARHAVEQRLSEQEAELTRLQAELARLRGGQPAREE